MVEFQLHRMIIAEALAEDGYRFGAVVIDAAHFVPQSRPRHLIPLPLVVGRSAIT
jgi:hypothetical protein